MAHGVRDRLKVVTEGGWGMLMEHYCRAGYFRRQDRRRTDVRIGPGEETKVEQGVGKATVPDSEASEDDFLVVRSAV